MIEKCHSLPLSLRYIINPHDKTYDHLWRSNKYKIRKREEAVQKVPINLK